MTATLSAAPLADVRLQVPRYGWPTAWATLATPNAAAVSTAPGALALDVAGLSLVCTCIRQGTRGELRTVELVGGHGGWRAPVPAAGFRLGNLVSLDRYAVALGLAAGERVELASGVDRKLAGVVTRLGDCPAGALLSQACAMPAGSSVVPWWVDLDGVTRLGPRTGAATSYKATDADPFGRRVSFAEDDVSRLLPGCTYGGATIEELRVIGDGESLTSTVTLAAPGEEPRTLAAGMRRLLLTLFGPHVAARTLYRYIVREVYDDGRIRAVPARSLLAPDLDGLRVWPGIAGGRCTPRAGSEILVQFADGDPIADAACVVGFSPALAGSTSIPLLAELDGDAVRLASSTTAPAVARVGDTGSAGSFSMSALAGVVSLTYTPPSGAPTVWALSNPSIGVLAVAPSSSASIGVEILTGSSKVQAG